jgi:hypothetical protein
LIGCSKEDRGNVAQHAIAKSCSRDGGACQRDRGIADELPMGPGGGTADRKGNTLGDLPPLTQGICFPESLAINRLTNAAGILLPIEGGILIPTQERIESVLSPVA